MRRWRQDGRRENETEDDSGCGGGAVLECLVCVWVYYSLILKCFPAGDSSFSQAAALDCVTHKEHMHRNLQQIQIRQHASEGTGEDVEICIHSHRHSHVSQDQQCRSSRNTELSTPMPQFVLLYKMAAGRNTEDRQAAVVVLKYNFCFANVFFICSLAIECHSIKVSLCLQL